MKLIQFTLSTDGENLGSFTLDPYAQIRLMADAKANKGLTPPEYVREALRECTLRDDYPGTIRCCGDGRDVAAISCELAAAN
jgi:hypothetical protein